MWPRSIRATPTWSSSSAARWARTRRTSTRSSWPSSSSSGSGSAPNCPTLGVCLGAQLIAGALGERVYRGDSVQIGFRRVEPTSAGAGSPIRHFDGVPVVEWHGDTFELPAEATLLASSSDYSNEAFAIGDHTLAVQFHPEVTDEMHERWVADGYNELDELAIDADALRAERERYSAAMQAASRAAFSEWLSGLDADADARCGCPCGCGCP